MIYVLVYITTSTPEEAEKIGKSILKRRLAACANIVKNMRSIYWWEGKLEKSSEALLLLKTKKEKLEDIISEVKKLHSYETPAILAIPILEGSKDYLEWIEKQLK